MAIELAALDLWNLFVNYVFGGFWLSVIGIGLLLFIIMGILGRNSIYTTMWYLIMFILVMMLGAGIGIISFMITLILLIAAFFSWKGYFER
jgi:hypothetical protein